MSMRCYLTGVFICNCPDGDRCWTSLRVLTGYLYIFFGEMSIQVRYPFFNWFFVFAVVKISTSLKWLKNQNKKSIL